MAKENKQGSFSKIQGYFPLSVNNWRQTVWLHSGRALSVNQPMCNYFSCLGIHRWSWLILKIFPLLILGFQNRKRKRQDKVLPSRKQGNTLELKSQNRARSFKREISGNYRVLLNQTRKETNLIYTDLWYFFRAILFLWLKTIYFPCTRSQNIDSS